MNPWMRDQKAMEERCGGSNIDEGGVLRKWQNLMEDSNLACYEMMENLSLSVRLQGA